MDSIGEVASANRVSPRPVSEERRTDSGAETAIVAPDLAAVKAAKQAVVNAAVSMVGHTSPMNDENRKDPNTKSLSESPSSPQKSPNLTALLASKRKPVASAAYDNTQSQRDTLNTAGSPPRDGAPNTIEKSPRSSMNLRDAMKKKADPDQRSSNSFMNRRSSAVDKIGSLKAQIQEKQSLLESLQSNKKATSNFSNEMREIEEAINTLTVDVNQTKEALRVVGDEIVRVREETLSSTKEMKICDQQYHSLQKSVLDAFSFVESIIDFKGKLKAKLQAMRAENVEGVIEIYEGKHRKDHCVSADILLRKYDHETLVLIAREMGKKLRVVEGGRTEAENYVHDAKQCKSHYEALRKEHKEMQELHLGQAKLIQKLQRQNSEIGKFKDTLLLQEKVIAKMQAIVETRLMPPMTADLVEFDGSNAHDRVAEEIYKLNLMIDGERQHQKDLEREYLETLEEKKETKKHIWDLETGIGSQKAIEKEKQALLNQLQGSDEKLQRRKDEVDHLETEINARDLRISALEEQMVMAARSTAKEISKLKTKLFDLEISMTEMEPSVSSKTRFNDTVDDNLIMKHYKEADPVPLQEKVSAAAQEDTPSGNATNAAQFLSNIKKIEHAESSEPSGPILPSLVIDTTVESPKSTARKSSARRPSSKKQPGSSRSRKSIHKGDKTPREEGAIDLKDFSASKEKSPRAKSPRKGSPQKPSTPKDGKPSKNAKTPKTPKTPLTENIDSTKEKSNQKGSSSSSSSKLAKKNLEKGEKGDTEEASATKEGKIDEPVSARLTSSPRKFSLINTMMKISPRMSLPLKDDKLKDDDDGDDDDL